MSVALVPLFGIRWSKKVIAAVDARPINRLANQLLAKVRNSPRPRVDYDRVADLFKLSYFAPAEFLPGWEVWRAVADRYRLDRRHSWAILAAAVTHLISAGARPPFELAALEPAALEQLMASLDDRHAARGFWRAARLSGANASSTDPFFLDQQNIDMSAFRRAIKRNRSELAAHQPPHPCDGRLRLPSDCDRMGPTARIKAIRASGQTALRVERFVLDRTQANRLKQVRGSLSRIFRPR